MDPDDSLANPAVQEIIEENLKLRQQLSLEPVADSDVDLSDLKFPVIFKNRLIFKPGIHNGVKYTEDEVKTYWKRAENKGLFFDHKDSCANQLGLVKNVKLDPSTIKVLGDLYLTDERAARNLLLGAKWGLSPTIDYDRHRSDGQIVAFNPDFKSFSFVLDPAIPETMLNKKLKEEVKNMSEENLDSISELLDLAIERASAMEDKSLLNLLKKIKDKYPKDAYPYPKEKMDALFSKVDELEEVLKKKEKKDEELSVIKRLEALENPKDPEKPKDDPEGEPEVSEEMKKLKKELEEKSKKLGEFEHVELEKSVADILEREVKLGITGDAEKEERTKELLEMTPEARDAVVAQIEKIDATLNAKKTDKPKDRATMTSGQAKTGSPPLGNAAEDMFNEMKSKQEGVQR